MNVYKNKLNIEVFLEDSNNYKIQLNNNGNDIKYTIDINSSFINKEFDLYISEKKIDDKVYLYRSSQKVKFTEIEAPKFIIDPNKTIVFSNVSCSLSSAAFKIIKADEPDILNYLSYWKYDSFNLIF